MKLIENGYAMPILIICGFALLFFLRICRVPQPTPCPYGIGEQEKLVEAKKFLLSLIENSLRQSGLDLYDFEHSDIQGTLRFRTQADDLNIRSIFTIIHSELFDFLENEECMQCEDDVRNEMLAVFYDGMKFLIEVHVSTWANTASFLIFVQHE